MLAQLGEPHGVEAAFQKQLGLLVELAKEDPPLFHIELLRGRLAYADWRASEREYSEAEQLYRELIDSCVTSTPGDADPEQISLTGTALGGLGTVLLARSELDAAKVAFEQAIERQEAALAAHPDHRRYRELLCRHCCRLGAVCKQLGDSARAGANWTKARDIFQEIASTTDPDVQYDVAWMLIGAAGFWDLPAIIKLAQEAIDRAPDSAAYWMALGVAECRRERWNDALDALNKSEQLGGGNSCVYFHLAIASWQTRRKAGSLGLVRESTGVAGSGSARCRRVATLSRGSGPLHRVGHRHP